MRRQTSDVIGPRGPSVVFVRWATAPVATGLVFAVLLGALAVGVRLPGLGILGLLPGISELDYGRVPGGFAPLRARFIEDVLGVVIPGGHGNGSTSPAAGTPGGARAVSLDPPTRVVDEHAFTNDDIEDARPVSSLPSTARTNAAEASREPNEPQDCGRTGGTSWYRLSSREERWLVANTFGTPHATSLGVFEGRPGALDLVGECSLSVRGNSLVQFKATRGKTYWFQIGAPAGGGHQVFNLEPYGTTSRLSPDHTGMEVPRRDSFYPQVSHDGSVVAFLSVDPLASDGFPALPCASNVPEPNVGSVFFTSLFTHDQTNLAAGRPCVQVVVVNRRTGDSDIASVSTSGEPANSDVISFHLAGDGRSVAFSTFADNMLPPGEDTNGLSDVFVHELNTRTTERVSVSSAEVEMTSEGDPTKWASARNPSISSDGRFVVFESSAANLIADDRSGPTLWTPSHTGIEQANVDVFVRDRVRGTTSRVSVSTSGEPADMAAVARENAQRSTAVASEFAWPCISANGRFIAFRSEAGNFDPADTNEHADVYLHDRITRRTELISVTPSGTAGDDASSTNGEGAPDRGLTRTCVSDSGRFVVFRSAASDLVGDDNEGTDLFVRDRWKGTTTVVGDRDRTGLGDVFNPSITTDGRYLAFVTRAPEDDSGQDLDGDGVPDLGDLRGDTYLLDILRGSLQRIGMDLSDSATAGDAWSPAISGDGTTVAFDSLPAGVPAGTSASVWVYDRPRFDGHR